MKFEFWTTPGCTHIKAILEEEDSKIGKREEGEGVEIELKETTLTYDYEVKQIHPDILGLICMANFYPFIGSSVEFPEPVSNRLELAFQTKWFTKDKKIDFRNVDYDIPKYSGNKMVISFGGGIDSSTVRVMFPEAFVVHEAHIRDGERVPCHVHTVVENLGLEKGRVVVTNQRYVSIPGGWHSWPCSTVTSLLMATDNDFGIILVGSTIGGTQLWKNGERFWDRHTSRKWHGFSGSHWQSTFHMIGIPMFSPVMGTSELETMRLALPLLHKGDVVYCMNDKGFACKKCAKCFRRDVIRNLVESEYHPNWVAYDTELIHTFLEKRPLYFGHIFGFSKPRSKALPDWFTERISDIAEIKSEWPIKLYQDVFDFCPESWREKLQERILEHIEPMTKREVIELKTFHQKYGTISIWQRCRKYFFPDRFIR